MAPRGLPELEYFNKLPGTPFKGGRQLECKFCRRAHHADPDRVPPPVVIVGRPTYYLKHLSRCAYYDGPPIALPGKTNPRRSAKSAGVVTVPVDNQISELSDSSGCGESPPTKRVARGVGVRSIGQPTRSRQDVPPSPFTETTKRISRAEKKHLDRLLLEFQVRNHLPDRFIECESTLALFEFLCPGITKYLPPRRTLGGRILKKHSERCQRKDTEALMAKQNQTRGRVNLLSDVWQNVSRDHLLACQLSLFGSTLTYALPNAGTRHDGIAIAAEIEAVLNSAISDSWDVGAIVTDNAGQCGKARRILAIRKPNIAFLRCFAHDINNLVKAVLKTTFNRTASDAAAVVNCLNGSSSKWLPRAKLIMTKFYGTSLSLCSLCETRWNSMQACFASLLRVQSALQAFTRRWQSDSEFPSQLQVLGDVGFWGNLSRVERVIRPLCNASYRLQRDENTLADVVISLRDIYLGFKCDPENRDSLIKCVEDRWKQCEQPLFMLGYALHPKHVENASELPMSEVSSAGRLCQFAVYYYRRLIHEEFGLVRRDMFRWLNGSFTRSKESEFPNDPVEHWKYMATENPDSYLPKLALTVLSIAVNTATCERLFSELALIHTARRNRMTSEKAKYTHIVSKHVRDRYRKVDVKKPFANRIMSPVEREITSALPERSALLSTSIDRTCSNEYDQSMGRSMDSLHTATTPYRTPVITGRDRGAQLNSRETPSRSASTQPRPSSSRGARRRLSTTTTPTKTPQAAPSVQPLNQIRLDNMPTPGFSASTPIMNSSPFSQSSYPAQATGASDAVPLMENTTTGDSDSEEENIVAADDPGDLAHETDTFQHWDEYLDEVIDDDEVGDGFEDTPADTSPTTAPNNWQNVSVNELERIPQPDTTPYPTYNDRNFPQEKRLTGIRSLKVTLAQLYG